MGWPGRQTEEYQTYSTLLYKIYNNNVDIEFNEIGLIPFTRPSKRHQEQFFSFQNNHWLEYSRSQCYLRWLCQCFQEPPNCDALMWRLSSVPVLVHMDTWELLGEDGEKWAGGRTGPPPESLNIVTWGFPPLVTWHSGIPLECTLF